MNNSAVATSSSSGIGLFGLTFLVLLVLKLANIAAISWFWVFFPLILGFSIWILFLLFLFLIVFLTK